MDYRPVGTLDETIVSGAEFTAESAVLFMSLIEMKKEVGESLQTKRENAFFEKESVFDVTMDDLDDNILPEREKEEILSLNSGNWDTVIRDCYCYRQSRDPERPLNRLESVSENVSIPIVDTQTMKFDADNVSLLNIDGEEAIEIHIDDNRSLVMYMDTDDMAHYNGMYHPPIARDINTLDTLIDNFDMLTIRTHSKEHLQIMNSHKPETVERDLAKTEVVLSNEIDKTTYIPQSVLNDDDNENSELDDDIDTLRHQMPLPDEDTERNLYETLTKGYMMSETRTKLFELMNQRDSVYLPYTYGASVEYLEAFSDLNNLNAVSIPQEKRIILSKNELPDWTERFDREYPDKNTLEESEKTNLYNLVDTPEFVDPTLNWDELSGRKELVLELYESETINHDDIVSYYVVPWDHIKPTKDSVMQAIEYGSGIRNRMKEVDEKYDVDLHDSIVVWEKRKVYKRDNHEK